MGAIDLKTSEREQPDPLLAEALDERGAPERVHYATGVLLDARDFADEQLYHRARNARALAALYGHGTIAGLRVAAAFKPDAPPAGTLQRLEIEVAPGAALDRLGRVVEVRRRQCLDLGRWWDAQAALPADAVARQRLVSAVRPSAGADPRVHLDVWLRFVNCAHGLTPAFAAGPFNATDFNVPHRMADGFELSFALSRLDGDRPVAPEPRSRELERRLAQLNAVQDPAELEAARRAWGVACVLDAWPAEAADQKGGLPRLAEHDSALPGSAGDDRTRVLLARVHVPVSIGVGGFPLIDRARWRALDAAVAVASAAEKAAVGDADIARTLRELLAAQAQAPVDNSQRPVVFNPYFWRGRLAADVGA
jgi:hypothetical protein